MNGRTNQAKIACRYVRRRESMVGKRGKVECVTLSKYHWDTKLRHTTGEHFSFVRDLIKFRDHCQMPLLSGKHGIFLLVWNSNVNKMCRNHCKYSNLLLNYNVGVVIVIQKRLSTNVFLFYEESRMVLVRVKKKLNHFNSE